MKRREKLGEIIAFLENLREQSHDEQYSIEQNIRFLRSAGTFRQFRNWFKTHQAIDKNRISELTDFENENFRQELHVQLIRTERSFVPGLILPAVKRLSATIIEQKKDVILADFGSGSMELTRQIIVSLIKRKFPDKVTIVAFDMSAASREIAHLNLKPHIHESGFHFIEHVNREKIETITQNSNSKINIVFCPDDIFKLSPDKIRFDISYHSFFKHHLSENKKTELDNVMKAISDIRFEYDGFYNSSGLFVQGLFTWKNPVLMNGAVFSTLRYPTIEKVRSASGQVEIFKRGRMFTWLGTYLRKF